MTNLDTCNKQAVMQAGQTAVSASWTQKAMAAPQQSNAHQSEPVAANDLASIFGDHVGRCDGGTAC